MDNPVDRLIELLTLFRRSGLVPTNPVTIRVDPASPPPAADLQQDPPVLVPYEVES